MRPPYAFTASKATTWWMSGPRYYFDGEDALVLEKKR